MRKMAMLTTALTVLGLGMIGHARAETVKIALIDPLSGPVAVYGDQEKKSLDFVLDIANREGWAGPGITFETVGFDNKGSPQEATQQFKNATDQGIRYIYQGLSSAVGLALIDAVNKYNERNPGKEVVYLNPTNTAPEMTNEKCSFWHFRFDANADMRMAALMSVLRDDASVKSVYLINPDYSFGHSVQREAKRQLAVQRPDVAIAAEELHPLLRIKDFVPYAIKIKASGAQAVITGNFANDLTLLVKAAREIGYDGKFYTFYGNALGAPAAIGDAGIGKVIAVADWLPNVPTAASEAFYKSFRQRYPNPADDYVHLRMQLLVEALAQAIDKAGTTQAVAVAAALENVSVQMAGQGGAMRASDHQFQQPLAVGVMDKVGSPGVKFDVEGSGYGFRVVRALAPGQAEMATTCRMVRPA